jgi:spore germination cell wall hydrolase CwlJ-like protein
LECLLFTVRQHGHLYVIRPDKDGGKMYKEYITRFILAGMVLVSSSVCARELKINRIAAKPAFRMEYMSESMTEDKKSFMEMISAVSSGQRVVDYEVLEQTMKYQLSDKDLEALQRIVEAEAGGEDQDGKLLVANVVLNRVNSEKFPDTVVDVVMQREEGVAQFSPTVDGRYQSVRISEDTREAVERALYGEDISQGALYFCAREKVDSERMQWFDRHLTKLFAYGHHEFFQ